MVAHSLGVELTPVGVRDAGEIERAIMRRGARPRTAAYTTRTRRRGDRMSAAHPCTLIGSEAADGKPIGTLMLR